MKNNELEHFWHDVELKKNTGIRSYQRMVCIDLLYRVYVGAIGMPAKRYISIEIPEDEVAQFDSFTAPKGFTLTLDAPSVKHDGFATCVLQSASHDQNDVFTIVALDILHELSKKKHAKEYVVTLKQRIAKWREFFKNPTSKKLTKEMVTGLWGELMLLKISHDSGITTIADMWNGPIKSAQDFQGRDVAIEVKTTTANQLDYVNISSEAQLDGAERKALYLVAMRIERNDANGITLPQLVDKVARALTEQQQKRFYAALLCLGYSPEDASLYNYGYTLRDQVNYSVVNGFPRLLRNDLPRGVCDLQYKVSLSSCSEYVTEWKAVVATIKEYEYG